MKVLKYTRTNVPKIAAQRGESVVTIMAELEEAERLQLTIYSVVDLLAYGYKTSFGSRQVIPGATYVPKDLLDKHYRFVGRENPWDYTEMEVANG